MKRPLLCRMGRHDWVHVYDDETEAVLSCRRTTLTGVMCDALHTVNKATGREETTRV